ncbi:hypothetical protein HU200_042007 [Digitaria exilis]|uniref:SANT domain-containing protein n=1 Tax=Digitaria exilis TaxID=1010633 RepID=A0A835B379_9POAL|nr:hypothetical protein HU200_042007 [Digitaria exilis]
MGPAKVSQTINKIRIIGYEDRQQHVEVHSSTKKRKISDLGAAWTNNELMCFHKAYYRHGKDWKKISAAVGNKSPDMVKALYTLHRTFLSLPKHQATSMGFIALVTGHGNILELSPSHKGNGQTIRASGKAKKHREATQLKAHEAAHPHDSCPAGTVSGFSTSFKKRYYGELARNTQSHPVRNRTPRVAVIVPTYRNATDDATPELENVISSAKRNDDKIKNYPAKFSTNEFSPDGRSGIMEAAKGFECQAFLEAKRTGETEICQTQRSLKKRRMDQTMDRCKASKVGYETVMAAREGNKPFEFLKAQPMFSPPISADDMLILEVLRSLVNASDKMSKFKINIPSGTLGKREFSVSESKSEGDSPVDLSKQGKLVHEFSPSKTQQKKHTKLVPTQINSAHSSDITEGASNSDSTRGIGALPESTADISCDVYPNVPREINPEISMSRRRKMKMKMHNKKKYMSCNEGSDNVQARKLVHCLSSELLRRWCTYEWFYSAIDFPWFMDNGFAEYLSHPYLRHISRLARTEWNIIRSYCGKPRRFSDNFLMVERKQLEDYRKEVRTYYAQLSDGSLDSLPVDKARPFSIGQQVIVRHPNSRELCDGKVVMVEHDCCKVQFDNPELGVDLVKDIDCMPVNWLDNLPYDVRSRLDAHDVHNILDTEHVSKLAPSGNRDHVINEISMLLNNLDITSDEQHEAEYSVDSEKTQEESTADVIVQYVDLLNNNDDHYNQPELYCSTFVQSLQSQAREMVDKVMQATSGCSISQYEEGGAGNQATNNCVNHDFGSATRDVQIPSKLIMNCTAMVLAIKCLADSRHPPANIAGILERFSAMLRPSCSENLAIYRDVEKHISILMSQTMALVPRTL